MKNKKSLITFSLMIVYTFLSSSFPIEVKSIPASSPYRYLIPHISNDSLITIDGSMNHTSEWNSSLCIDVTNPWKMTEIDKTYFLWSDNFLYVGFYYYDENKNDEAILYLDTNFDNSSSLMIDDVRFRIRNTGSLRVEKWSGVNWQNYPITVGYAWVRNGNYWSVEMKINLTDIGSPSSNSKQGFMLYHKVKNAKSYFPPSADVNTPNTWGMLTYYVAPPYYRIQINFQDYNGTSLQYIEVWRTSVEIRFRDNNTIVFEGVLNDTGGFDTVLKPENYTVRLLVNAVPVNSTDINLNANYSSTWVIPNIMLLRYGDQGYVTLIVDVNSTITYSKGSCEEQYLNLTLTSVGHSFMYMKRIGNWHFAAVENVSRYVYNPDTYYLVVEMPNAGVYKFTARCTSLNQPILAETNNKVSSFRYGVRKAYATIETPSGNITQALFHHITLPTYILGGSYTTSGEYSNVTVSAGSILLTYSTEDWNGIKIFNSTAIISSAKFENNKITLSVTGPSSLYEIIAYSPAGMPRQVLMNGQPIIRMGDYGGYQINSNPCWFYNTLTNQLYIKVETHSPTELVIAYGGVGGAPQPVVEEEKEEQMMPEIFDFIADIPFVYRIFLGGLLVILLVIYLKRKRI